MLARKYRLSAFVFSMALLSAPIAQAGTNYIGDLANVTPIEDKTFDEFYLKNGANFAGYSKIYIEPIDVLEGRDKDLDDLGPRDLQNRQDYLHEAFSESFGQHFEVVNQPGPGVLVLDAAITSVWFNKPTHEYQTQSRKISLSYSASFYTGKAAFQADIRDGGTGELLAVVVDQRKGWDIANNHRNRWRTWGDANDFMTRWARELPQRLR